MNKLREALAETAHISWSGWTLYLLQKGVQQADGSVLLPAGYVSALAKQALTGYAHLSEAEKELDRAEANSVLDTLRLHAPVLRRLKENLEERLERYEGDHTGDAGGATRELEMSIAVVLDLMDEYGEGAE